MNDDIAAVREDETVNIAVLENDMDPDGDPIEIAVNPKDAHGVVVLVDNLTGLAFSPAANFNGTTTFTYRSTDRVG